MNRRLNKFFHMSSGQDLFGQGNVFILWFALFFFLIACNTASAEEPLRIGLSLGLTGKYAASAEIQQRGYRLWEKDINRRGGILNRKVILTVYDDESDPQKAVEKYKQLIFIDKVDLVFAPFSSQITDAVMPLLEENHYPILAAGASASNIYEKEYGDSPSYFAVTAFSAGQIIEAAIKRAGSLDRVQIRDSLANLDTNSLVGRYSVYGTGRPVKSFTLVNQVQNGKQKVVWPQNLKTADPIF